MFEGGVSKSFSIFPIRVVYMPVEQGEAPASILISVSEEQISPGGRIATPGAAVSRCLYLSVGRAYCNFRIGRKDENSACAHL